MTPAPAEIAAALAWLWDPDGDPLEVFERVAEEFRRDTGHLRPGKSYPMECAPSEEEQKAVRAEWAAWCASRQRAVLATLRAAPSLAREALAAHDALDKAGQDSEIDGIEIPLSARVAGLAGRFKASELIVEMAQHAFGTDQTPVPIDDGEGMPLLLTMVCRVLSGVLEENGAPNYYGWGWTDETDKGYRVRVEHAEGKSPEEIAHIAREEAKALRAEVESLRAQLAAAEAFRARARDRYRESDADLGLVLAERDQLRAQLAALTPKPPPEPAADPWAAYAPATREMVLEDGKASRRRGEPRLVIRADCASDPPLLALVAGWDIEDARLARVADEDDGALDAPGESGGAS